MKLTLEMLSKASTYSQAKNAFIKTCGFNAEVDAKQIFFDLADADREQFIEIYDAKPEQWLSWLGYSIPGFLEAIGNEIRGKFGNFTFGHHVNITIEFAFFSGQSSGEFYDQSTGLIYERYTSDVKVVALSDMACVVNRRSGKPALILKEQESSDETP